MKKKTNKKVASALAMLMLSAAMLGTSTYAWFTMNKQVEVTGLSMKTKVSSNLLISSNNGAGTYKADQLVEARQALLEPVSSNTGKTGTFYYTLDAAENGSKAHATSDKAYVLYNEGATAADAAGGSAVVTAAGKYKYDSAFNTAYGISPSATEYSVAYGYIDYVFYLKATGDSADQALRMTACDLNYTYPTGNDGSGDKAWRVALFATQLTDAQAGTGNSGAVGQIDPAASAAKAILKIDGAGYFTADSAVNSTTALGTVSYGSAVIDADIDAGVTKYYKVLVRVWLEGEDTSCTSATYAKLSDAWTLDVEFKLTDSTSTATGETVVTNVTKNAFTPDITDTQTAVPTPIEVVPTP